MNLTSNIAVPSDEPSETPSTALTSSYLSSNVIKQNIKCILLVTLFCIFNCFQREHWGTHSNPTLSLPTSAPFSVASGPPVDEPFWTHMWVNNCIKKSNHKRYSSATSNALFSATSHAPSRSLSAFLDLPLNVHSGAPLDCIVKWIIKCSVKCMYFFSF